MDISVYKDERGLLIPFELSKFPFEVKRIFVVSGTQNSLRGKHAHHQTDQLLFCLSGMIQVRTTRTGNDWLTTTLQQGQSLYHPKMEWAEIFFSHPNSMLISFCSTEHSDKDYIKNYSTFLDLAKDKYSSENK